MVRLEGARWLLISVPTVLSHLAVWQTCERAERLSVAAAVWQSDYSHRYVLMKYSSHWESLAYSMQFAIESNITCGGSHRVR